MSVPAWFWPSAGSARGSALVPYAAGMAVADWSTPQLWPFLPSTSKFSSPIVLATGTPGLCGATTDNAGNVWALTYAGQLYKVQTNGSFTLANTFASGNTYVGLVSGGGGIYAVAASGQIYGYNTPAASGLFGAPAYYAVSGSSTLYSLIPSLSGIGTFPLAGGVSGLISLPSALAAPSCLTYGTKLAAGGWATAPTLAGGFAAALNPQVPTYMLATGSGVATVWTAPGQFSDAWTQVQQLTGLDNLRQIAWRPDGVQALATTSNVYNAVQVLNYNTGTLTLAQTFTVSGARSIMIAGNSVSGLVSMSGQAQIAPISYAAGSWSSGAPITGFTNITALSAAGVSGAYAIFSGSISYLSLATGNWAVNYTTALGFTPAVLCTDYFGNAWTAGSGVVAQVSSAGVILASGTWTGSAPTAIAVRQGRVIMAIPADNLIRVFGLSAAGVVSQQSSVALSLGTPVGLGLSATTLFVLGSGATQTYGFSGAPFTLTSVLSGAIATYNGSAWTTYALGIGHLPSAMTFDASGSLQTVTEQNTWWTLTSGGAVSSGIVTQVSGQSQSVPLGSSAVFTSGSNMYVSTSLPGVLVQVA